MRIERHASWIVATLTVACAACGGSGGSAPSESAHAPLTAADVRSGPPPADSSAASDRGARDTASTAIRSETLYSVQVGAFVRGRNAAALEKKLEADGFPVWMPSAHVEGRSFERVRVGATKSVAQARRLADRLEDSLRTDFWVAPVAPDETIPRKVVTGTQKALQGS